MRQAKVIENKRISPIVAAIVALPALVMLGGCGGNDFLGLEDYQRDILLWLLQDPEEGGVDCWDLNGDGIPDAGEDVNGDGVVDVFDCRGVNCWDLDGDGVGDPGEDINGDGAFDALDCRAEPTADGGS